MSASKVIKLMKEKEVEYVDLRFTDPRGKLQHLTMDGKIIDEKMLNEGVFFDGSSIAGWKSIHESDMLLKPDLERTIIDPFTSHSTLVLFVDVLDAVKKDPYERDPRSIAKKAEAYLKKSGIGDKAYFGPEAEFFVFDNVKYKNDMNETGFKIDSAEGPYNTGKDYENGNMGHRPGIKGGYFPVPPVDSAQDMRGEFLKALRDMGIKAEKHHHEVAPSQHELGMYFNTLLIKLTIYNFINMGFKWLHTPLERQQLSCQNQSKEIMVLVCIHINLCGREIQLYFLEINMQDYPTQLCIILVVF